MFYNAAGKVLLTTGKYYIDDHSNRINTEHFEVREIKLGEGEKLIGIRSV